MKCPHCHNDEVPAEATFCPLCGQKIEKEPEIDASTPRLIVTTKDPSEMKPKATGQSVKLVTGDNEILLSNIPDLAFGFRFCSQPENITSVKVMYFALKGTLVDTFAGCCNMTYVCFERFKIRQSSISRFMGKIIPIAFHMFKDCNKLKTIQLIDCDEQFVELVTTALADDCPSAQIIK